MRQKEIICNQLFEDLQKKLKLLKLKLDDKKKDFKKKSSWSIVGDIELINRQLKLITENT
jgi:activator of HSP90 ATPase